MRLKVIAFGMALALIAAPGYAQVRGFGGFGGHPGTTAIAPSVVAPYRFALPSSPTLPSTSTSPAKQQEMLDYQSQLQGQVQQLQNQQALHQLGPLGRQDLNNTENELNQLNNTLER